MSIRRLSTAFLSLALLLSGCHLLEGLPFGAGRRPVALEPHVIPQTQPLMYRGDLLAFAVSTSSALVETARITLTHRASAEARIREVPASELAGFTLALEPDALPGYAEDALNRYRIEIATKAASGERRESGGELWVVSDREIQPPPRRRIMSGPGYPESWTTGGSIASLEDFARKIAQEDWGGQDLTMTRRELPKDERPPMPRVPSDAVLWEFLAAGTFPRYALSAELSGTGQETLMTPKQLKIVLTLSNPITVVAVKAFEEPR
jgi:hypothetical protein